MTEIQTGVETGTEVAVVEEPVYVQTFEGALVTQMQGKLPAISLEMDESYARGTHLRLQVEVRVKSIRYDEDKRGDMIRQHVFALESIQLVSSFSPEDAVDTVGGSASVGRTQSEEDISELGMQFGRTSDTWEQPRAVGL